MVKNESTCRAWSRGSTLALEAASLSAGRQQVDEPNRKVA
jgi:hypothetical protein